MDPSICPYARDNDWLTSSVSPHHVPAVVQRNPAAFRVWRSGRDLAFTAIRLSGSAGTPIATAAKVTRAT